MDNNKTEYKFIKTSDPEMVNQLIIAGFTEVGEAHDGVHCFLNDGKKLNFNETVNRMIFTNILCL